MKAAPVKLRPAKIGRGIGRLLPAALLGLSLREARAAYDLKQDEVVAAVGLAGVRHEPRAVQTRFEYHFHRPVVWELSPYLAAGLSSDGASHFGGGFAYRKRLGERWRVLAGFGPALYRHRHGPDLGHELEFFSFVGLDRRLAPGRSLGLRFAHVSNAGLGNRNPGREMLGLVYTAAWGRLRSSDRRRPRVSKAPGNHRPLLPRRRLRSAHAMRASDPLGMSPT